MGQKYLWVRPIHPDHPFNHLDLHSYIFLNSRPNPFGSGLRACPGGFFAQEDMNLMFIQL
ncbi:hypothetical protein N656DRAFT_774327 [Canariomyces notabilis]|uniref:Cytochrome P450 n=1 Tax=Canariomyces notabilis TaxID=2074819 RepID=A0AAN6YX36_9PEZI|nr:hypothetical protein N656DRAFT_774327 [Canariomyces arenarius]